MVDVGGGVAFPLDCLDKELRPLDGALTALLVVVGAGGVAVTVEGVAFCQNWANEAIFGVTKGG